MSTAAKSPGSSKLYASLIAKANTAIQNNALIEAKAHLQKAKQHGADFKLYGMLGICEEIEGNNNKALTLYNKSLSLSAEQPVFLVRAAYMEYQLGNLAKARALYEQANQISPNDATTLKCLAGVYEDLKLHFNSLQALIQLHHVAPLSPYDHAFIADALERTSTTLLNEEFEPSLIQIIELEGLNPAQLSLVLSDYFVRKYGLNKDDVTLESQLLMQDALFISALKRVCFKGYQLEELLTELRKALLLDITQSAKIPEAAYPLLDALAINNHLNEYVHAQSEPEVKIIESLCTLVNSTLELQEPPQKTLNAISDALRCIALYRRLDELPFRDALVQIPAEHWPKHLHLLVQETLLTPNQERIIQSEIESLTDVTNQTSQAAREQYEPPSPRWIAISTRRPTTYGRNMEHVLPGYRAPDQLHGPEVEILIAGCGTGQYSSAKAIEFEHAQFTAIDISRRSLAYAKRKSEDYKLSNITYYHADLLQMDKVDNQYDVIESCGVLHHLKNPMEGWQSLIKNLKEDGVMLIGLYSQIARRSISKQRHTIAELKISATEASIRTYRQALLKQSPNDPVLNWREFWSLSECRDLLFHTQEHQYTWLIIQECLDQLGLEFIGLNGPRETFELYQRHFPGEETYSNLDNWHSLEQKHPDLFATMYNFWCRKKH